MKSAYELAIERHGGEKPRKLKEEQKAKIAEIDRRYQARIAEVELSIESTEPEPGREDNGAAVQEKLREDIAELRERSEQEKEKIRNAGD